MKLAKAKKFFILCLKTNKAINFDYSMYYLMRFIYFQLIFQNIFEEVENV